MLTEASSAQPSLADFIGPRAFEIVNRLSDLNLKVKVATAIGACSNALAVIDGLDLSPHELADLETPNVAAWNTLAPDIRNVLLAVRQCSDTLVSLFPSTGPRPSDSFDDALADAISRETRVDDIVRGSGVETVSHLGDNLRMLAVVLQNDIIALGGKLRTPQVVGDRWFLLAELHQFLNQCGQCLEAIVATILNALTDEAVADVLPRYLDATSRAIRLRSAVVDLHHDLDRYNTAITQASGVELEILKNGVVERITQFSELPVYKFLSPQDKRAVILFRIFLNSWEKAGSDVVKLRQELEGFSKFLPLMRELNWRDALAESDRRALLTIEMVLESGVDVPMVKPYLERVYGRHPAIDDALRALRDNREPAREGLLRVIKQAIAAIPPI